MAKPAGLVLDIVKAFNCLHRPLLGCLLQKLGLPRWLWPCWERALTSMTRRVQLGGFHYQGSKSSTGFRRETPLRLEVCLPIPSCLVQSFEACQMAVQGMFVQ